MNSPATVIAIPTNNPQSHYACAASPKGADVSASFNPQPGRRRRPQHASVGTLPRLQREGRKGAGSIGRLRHVPFRTPWIIPVLAIFVFLAGWSESVAAPEDSVAIRRLVISEAMATRVPPSLALAVARIESAFNPNALSSAGARGVMQIMPKTARDEFGVAADELWDARLNVQLGIDFLEQLYDRYGRWDLALSHYNGGSVSGKGVNARPLPATRKYVQTVLKWEQRYRRQAATWAIAQAQPDSGWQAARTKTDTARPQIVERDVGARQPVEVAIVEPKESAARRWLPVHQAAGKRQHPIDAISIRRLRVRPSLDDFTPVVRWWNG